MPDPREAMAAIEFARALDNLGQMNDFLEGWSEDEPDLTEDFIGWASFRDAYLAKQQPAEVERLRAHNDELAGVLENSIAYGDELEAEVGRLRAAHFARVLHLAGPTYAALGERLVPDAEKLRRAGITLDELIEAVRSYEMTASERGTLAAAGTEGGV